MSRPKTVWFTTLRGGQLGVDVNNIAYLCTDFVMTKNRIKWMLDPSKWVEHRYALVNGCV